MVNHTLGRAWADAIEGYAVAVRSAGRSEETVRLRRVQVRQLALGMADREPWAVTLDDLQAWTGGKHWSLETRRAYRDALRGFYDWAVQAGHLERSPAKHLARVPKPGRRPKPVTDLVYARALERANEWERLALRLGAEAGLRRSEIAQVHASDLLPDLGGLSLHVHGKGGRDRTVPLPTSLGDALVRACAGGWAFPGPTGHLSGHYVGQRLSALMPAGVSAHGLRHRFATKVYQATRDVFVVQDLLGHASPETTRRYVDLGGDAMRRAVEAVAA
jgi:integrase/recombinase XerC